MLCGPLREKYGNPPLHGTLRLASTVSPSLIHEIEEFQLRFAASSGGRLSITHRTAPQRELFATRGGHSFLAATTGMPIVRPLFLHHPHDPVAQRLSYEEFLTRARALHLQLPLIRR